MRLYRHKKLKTLSAALATLFLGVFFCFAPNVSTAYAQSPAEAILSKSNFGILKKINNGFYLIDQFGNIIDTVSAPLGVDLGAYVGKEILVKGNIFAGLTESPKSYKSRFLDILNRYLKYRIKPNPKPGPVIKPVQPMYGIFPVYPEPKPEPIIAPPPPAPMYAIIFPKPGPVVKPLPKEPVCKPMYAVEPYPKKKKPPIGPPYVKAIYAIEPPLMEVKLDEEALERNNVIEKQKHQRAELRKRGIEIVSNLAEKVKPFQGNKQK